MLPLPEPFASHPYVVTITYWDDKKCVRGSVLVKCRADGVNAAESWAEGRKLDFFFCEYEITTLDGVKD